LRLQAADDDTLPSKPADIAAAEVDHWLREFGIADE
jgi:hypothetical protein